MEPDLARNEPVYAALRRSLDSRLELDEVSAAPVLCGEADTLIANFGIDDTVNRLPAWVTAGYVQRDDLAAHPLFVRLAKLKKPGEGDELPIFVFGDSPNIDMKTPNLRAFRFKQGIGEVALRVEQGIDPLVNSDEYLALAAELIKEIGDQSAEKLHAEQVAKAERKYRVIRAISGSVKNYFTDTARASYYSSFDTIGERRRVTLGASMLVLLLSYGHLPFGNEDAKIGPVPMPYPIEAVVDLDNESDHEAQGFREPQAALQVRVGDENVKIPLIDTYDTKGVPDATNTYGVEESKPGLYKVDIVFKPEAKKEEQPNASSRCIVVEGDYRNGQTRIFTQDLETAAQLRVSVGNTKELKACVSESLDKELDGTFYVWQKL